MTMTKPQALTAMEGGYKVTREYFSSDEYICIEERAIVDENGYDFKEWWEDIEPTIPATSDKCWDIYSK